MNQTQKKQNGAKPKDKKNNNKTKRRDKAQTKVVGEVVAFTSRGNARMPRTSTKNGGTVVSHTETFGQNIVGTSTFSVLDAWAIQPGISTYSRGEPLGVWLPQIAGNFDHYEIESLVFKYRTACSTLTPGLAVFAFEPNPEGTVPKTYQEMRNMYSADNSVHGNFIFDVSSRVKGRRLIRKTTVLNLPSYDMGKVYFATVGVTDGALCGFVDVEYRIKLINPQSAVTSNEVVSLTNSIPMAPVQQWECDSGGWGGINCAASSEEWWNHFCASARAPVGANLASFQQIPTLAAATFTVNIGNKFVNGLRTGPRMMRIAKSGRYRLTLQPRLDFEDLKLFCMGVFQVIGTAATTRVTRKVFTTLDATATTDIPAPILACRGFTGTAVGDPNPATEFFNEYNFEFDCPADNTDFLVRIGVLNYNDVSTTTANIQGRPGLGDSVATLMYLGPLNVI